MLPIVGRHADVWHTFGSPREIGRMGEVVDRSAEKAGRDPASIARAASLSLSEPWDEIRANIEGLEKERVSYLTVSWPSEGKERLDEFVSTVMPDYA
jgi:alkanesulfonate monooxygenase SsuD/methylene tetrahydromethanopterin reductase-like flavin-dependent oxidoreductase (luciferase family)